MTEHQKPSWVPPHAQPVQITVCTSCGKRKEWYRDSCCGQASFQLVTTGWTWSGASTQPLSFQPPATNAAEK